MAAPDPAAEQRPAAGGRRALALVLALFTLLAALHAWRLPVFEGPDEPGNLLYVRYLAAEGHLATPTTELSPELELLDRGIVPPLWFLATVPVFQALHADRWQATPTTNPEFIRGRTLRQGETVADVLADPNGRLQYLHGRDEQEPFSGANLDVRLLRATTIAWGVLALFAVWRCARRVTRGDGVRAAWITALAATTPQLQHLAGTISMDLMLAAWGGLCLASALAWIEVPRRATAWALSAGLFAGLAAATKLNGLVLIPLAPLAAWLAWREGARALRPLLAFGVGLALTAGPYYVWSALVSGHPLWGWHYQSISPLHNPPGQPPGIAGFAGWMSFVQTLFLTWFADFGWTAVWFPGWVNAGVGVLLAVGAGALVSRRSLPSWRDGRRRGLPLAFLIAAAFLILAAEVYFNLRFPQPHGRHLYPFLPALIVPLGVGLERARLLKPVLVVQLVLSVAAFPLLVDRLRPAGWNDDPRWSVTDERRRADPDLVDPNAAEVVWLAPAPGSVLSPDAAPVLQWAAREGAHYDVVLAIDNPRFEAANWDRPRVVMRALWAGFDVSGALPLPADFWGAVRPGQTLSVQVLELGADGTAVGRSPRVELQKAD